MSIPFTSFLHEDSETYYKRAFGLFRAAAFIIAVALGCSVKIWPEAATMIWATAGGIGVIFGVLIVELAPSESDTNMPTMSA